LLAKAPSGYPETLLSAHGFKTKILDGLIRAGLATEQREIVTVDGKAIDVGRLRIAAAGLKAIEDLTVHRPSPGELRTVVEILNDRKSRQADDDAEPARHPSIIRITDDGRKAIVS
jgi:hypothetical protein